jgi:protein MpaA
LGDKRVVLIPISNPDGYERKMRHNANGVDLNRNFPAENYRSKRRHGNKPLTQPESKAIFDAIERFRPGCIISIHQDRACIDYDGPARELASSMSKSGKLKLKRLGALPGSLGSYAGDQLGIPVITVELPGGLQGLNEDELWSRYGSMLVEPLRWKKGELRRALPDGAEP